MRWPRSASILLSIALLLPAWSAAGPAQRKRHPRARSGEQTVPGPGVISRQGRYWVEEISGSIPAAPRVRIESPSGAIELRGAAQQEIHYRIEKRVSAGSEESARRILAEYPLQVRRRGDLVEMLIEAGRDGGIQAHYTVTVPKSTAMAELETRGGSITAREIDGALKASTAGGSIDVDRIGGAVELETRGGSITMGTLGGSVRAQTAGGNIKLSSSGGGVSVQTAGGGIDVGRAESSVRAQTAGGSIRIGSAGGDVTAQTAGGSVTIGEAGRVTAVTAGGSIQVDSARAMVRAETAGGSIRLSKCAGPVRAETAGGSITAFIVAGRNEWADSLLETSVGDITVHLPDDLAVTIRAAIERAGARHSITSDFPLTLHAGEGVGPREIVGEGKLNGGGAPLRLRTTSGNIEIRKNR